jgi:hypothetical protein
MVVDHLVDRPIPLVWKGETVTRVLDPSLKLEDQVLVLVASCSRPCSVDELFCWTDYHNRSYFNRLIRKLHVRRMLDLSADEACVQILPPGSKFVEEVILQGRCA